MGEEKKESKDIKKLKYEQPRLVRLTGAKGAGDCVDGSGDAGECYTGNTAGISCDTGNTAGTACISGNAPVAPQCTTGSGVSGG